MPLPLETEPTLGLAGAAALSGSTPSTDAMAFKMHARRKGGAELEVIAEFKNNDDSRAALWAVVFTGQYAEVNVKQNGTAEPIAEWPAGLTALRCSSEGLRPAARL